MHFDRSVIKKAAKFRDVEKYSFIVEYMPPTIRSELDENSIFGSASKKPIDL